MPATRYGSISTYDHTTITEPKSQQERLVSQAFPDLIKRLRIGRVVEYGDKKDLQVYKCHRGGRAPVGEIWCTGGETGEEKEADPGTDEKGQPEEQGEALPEEDEAVVLPGRPVGDPDLCPGLPATGHEDGKRPVRQMDPECQGEV